jgi:hypothetical protein
MPKSLLQVTTSYYTVLQIERNTTSSIKQTRIDTVAVLFSIALAFDDGILYRKESRRHTTVVGICGSTAEILFGFN